MPEQGGRFILKGVVLTITDGVVVDIHTIELITGIIMLLQSESSIVYVINTMFYRNND